MSNRDQIMAWVDEKLSLPCSTVREERSISHIWRRVTGGRILFASLSMQVSPSERLSISIDQTELGDEYARAIRDGIFCVLMGHAIQPILGLSIEVADVSDAHEGSCYMAFHAAAREATLALLGFGDQYESNVVS